MSGISKLAGVCGWPIHHSLSPLLHNFWLKEAGIAGAYVHFAVRPDEAVHAFQTLKQTSIQGVNVTLPLKNLAFEAADEVSEDAQKLGAVNCLYKRDGKLIGHNTDMEGFVSPLIQNLRAGELEKSKALVIGAGGAAKAVIAGLLALGIPEICLLNRTDEKAAELVRQAALPSLYTTPWADRQAAVKTATLIINASAAGMKGYSALDIDLSGVPKEAFVYDLVYTPMQTPLLRQAKSAGLKTLGGLDMLIAQARPSFKLFFGQLVPDASDARGLLMKALRAR